MVKVDLKGVASATAKGKTYFYAWRGGPRLPGVPGAPEFVLAYQEAHASRRQSPQGQVRALVTLYRASVAYRGLAESTRRQWGRWLDRIVEHFGELPIAAFDRPERIRPIIRRWRNQWADSPRTADYAIQVLSRVLAYAVDPLDKIAVNPCDGIQRLYSANRAAVIWTDTDIAALKLKASPEICLAVDLAAATGLRRGDLLRLSWSHVGEQSIEIATGKSGGRTRALIPLYSGLRQVLDAAPKRSTAVLVNGNGLPWTTAAFGNAFNRAKIGAGMAGLNLHFHDLRGTAATRFKIAGLDEKVIAEIMGWEEASVASIIRRYVERSALTQATIERLNKTQG